MDETKRVVSYFTLEVVAINFLTVSPIVSKGGNAKQSKLPDGGIKVPLEKLSFSKYGFTLQVFGNIVMRCSRKREVFRKETAIVTNESSREESSYEK